MNEIQETSISLETKKLKLQKTDLNFNDLFTFFFVLLFNIKVKTYKNKHQ